MSKSCEKHAVPLMEGEACKHCRAEKRAAKERVCYIGVPEVFSLQQCCYFLFLAFGEMPYLVGSATEKREFRDVDIRMIFDDEKYVQLFGPNKHGELSFFWSLIMTSVSEWLAKRTGLKCDFQIHARSMVKQSDWDKFRQPMAVFLSEQDPPWFDVRVPCGLESKGEK